MPASTWNILTPPAGQGAIAVVQIRGDETGPFGCLLDSIGLDIPVGRPLLLDLLGVDRGLAVRWETGTIDLFCHGGPAIVRRLTTRLTDRGFAAAKGEGGVYPEAGDVIEHRMLETLARAASPLAVDLLLDQPRRWRAHADGPFADAVVLNRLVVPPLVVAVGPANIGKSTLLNTLAGRAVAIVADEPGTTRDHVGATLDMGGLTVRYLDTPGRHGAVSPIDAEAIGLVEQAERAADLVLLCGDPATPCLEFSSRSMVLRVCLRADLGDPSWSPDIAVCSQTGAGVDDLVRSVRERLVPDVALADPRPWRFWEPVGP